MASSGGDARACMDPEEKARSDVFQRLKAICVPLSQLALMLTRDAKAENRFKIVNGLEDLAHTLSTIPPDLYSTQLGDYVFFPLSHLLRLGEKLDDRTTELVLQNLELLIRNTWGKNLNPELGKQMCILITFFIDDGTASDPTRTAKSVSDETKRAGARALLQLFRAASVSRGLRDVFRDGDNIPTLAHTIAVAVKIVLDSDDVDCELAAADCLRVLLISVIGDGDIIASFLPGISSTLCRVITPSIKRAHFKVLTKCVELLALLIAHTIPDNDLGEMLESDGSDPASSHSGSAILDSSIALSSSVAMSRHASDEEGSSSSGSSGRVRVKGLRSKAWIEATRHQVKLALDPVTRLRTYQRPEVRMEVRNFCARLLQTSFRALENCRSVFLITLIFLSSDSDYDVSFESFDFVRNFGRDNDEVIDLVKEGVYGWINGLQRTLSMQDEPRKTGLLLELKVGIDLLIDWDLDMAFLQESFVSNFLGAISLTASESPKVVVASDIITSSDIVSLQRGATVEISRLDEGRLAFPPLDIQRMVGVNATEYLEQILENVGISTNGRKILNDCIRIASDSENSLQSQQVAYWMYVHMVKGVRKSIEIFEDDSTRQLLSQSAENLNDTSVALIQVYLDNDDISPENTSLVLVSLEALSLSADIMGVDFKLSLMDILYPVLNLIASSSIQIRQHAYVALNNIAMATNYGSVSELLVDNVDYVLDSISLRINTLDISPRTPKILSVLIKLAGSSSIPYLDDIIASIFQLLDNYHGYSRLVEGFFEVLRAVVEETSIAYLTSSLSIEEKPRSKRPGIWDLESLLTEIQRAPEFILHERGNPPVEEKVENDAGHELSEENGFEEHELEKKVAERDEYTPDPAELWTSPVPKPWYMIIRRIASLTKYYLSHESPSLRYQLLDLLHTGMPILATSEKELLPLINDTWPPVVQRLSDPEFHIIVAALVVISDYSNYSGDFMSSRIEQAWPIIRSLLPCELPREREGRFSRPAQLYKAATASIGTIVRHTRLKEETFNSILESVAPFLRYNNDLRQAMEEISRDAVWLYSSV
ncbi:armadillo-type protein [Lipomyces tetrasporus]|uniref:Armadillo-type protein n=1 Tax=Lipomyces tetrasporus TaxID=54092 RepID=A0AAD7VTU4_9ASCO|nr:armadillo-type protein [Lipomyces tetrasporus]KAJ8100525.1 armadillo-type protein [Lipomyces tetrasporus]